MNINLGNLKCNCTHKSFLGPTPPPPGCVWVGGCVALQMCSVKPLIISKIHQYLVGLPVFNFIVHPQHIKFSRTIFRSTSIRYRA